ncbi:MAG: hypothetical protein ACQESR_28085 [Planctomycetota bacterium]
MVGGPAALGLLRLMDIDYCSRSRVPLHGLDTGARMDAPGLSRGGSRSPLQWPEEGPEKGPVIFQAAGLFRVDSYPTQAVLPLVGLAAEKIIRDRYISHRACLGGFGFEN